MTDRSGQEVTAALIAAVNAHDLDGIVDQFSGRRPKRDSGPSGAQLRGQRSGPPQLGADPRSGQRPARRGPLVDDYHGYHDRPRDGLAGARVRWPAARRRAVADAGRDGQRGRRWTDRRPPLLYGAGRDRRFRRRRSRSTDHDAGRPGASTDRRGDGTGRRGNVAMILVAGGTGLLGRQVVARLVSRNVPVRVLTRDAAHAAVALGSLAERVEIVTGDVRDPVSLAPAVAGVDTVVAAVQGFGGRQPGGLAAVDRDGNLNLVRASATAGVSHFLLLSIHDATPADPLALGRAKAAVEAELRTTAMIPILVRPTAYMETWAGIVGGPILASGKAPDLRPRAKPDQLRVVRRCSRGGRAGTRARHGPACGDVLAHGRGRRTRGPVVRRRSSTPSRRRSADRFRPRMSHSRCFAPWPSRFGRSSRSSPTRSRRRSSSTPRTAAPEPWRWTPSARWFAARRRSMTSSTTWWWHDRSRRPFQRAPEFAVDPDGSNGRRRAGHRLDLGVDADDPHPVY